MPSPRLLRPVVGVLVAVLALLPATASAAPIISGEDGRVWNAATFPPTYTITSTDPDPTIRWELWEIGRLSPVAVGPVPETGIVPLEEAPDGRLRLVAVQTAPRAPRPRTARTFSVDTTPPGITVERPVAGAVYERGQQVIAEFTCTDAVPGSCVGTVAGGAAVDTSTAGTHVFTVTATDPAGNTAEENVEYRVAAAPQPAPPPSAGTAGAPQAPSPPIRLDPSPTDPGDEDAATPAVQHADRLRPAAGAEVTVRRPVLRWAPVSGARLYNLQIYRVRDGRVTKILSEFPRGDRFRVPPGRLAWGERYAWRVWPLLKGSYPDAPHGQSWFELRRPVRLAPAQLLVNQRISQAALRRTAAISDWVDAGLVTGDLRDGGLGRQDFAGDVQLSGDGAAIANGLATPRPLVTAARTRSGARGLRVSARQLLINQRISQAAVLRANALARRLDGRLTGGDLHEGAVTATKLAPGLLVAAARPAGAGPAASSTAVRRPDRSGTPRVSVNARQLLINQRISQAAVRRANATRALIEGGLTGANFRDGTIAALRIAPALRS